MHGGQHGIAHVCLVIPDDVLVPPIAVYKALKGVETVAVKFCQSMVSEKDQVRCMSTKGGGLIYGVCI